MQENAESKKCLSSSSRSGCRKSRQARRSQQMQDGGSPQIGSGRRKVFDSNVDDKPLGPVVVQPHMWLSHASSLAMLPRGGGAVTLLMVFPNSLTRCQKSVRCSDSYIPDRPAALNISRENTAAEIKLLTLDASSPQLLELINP
ncbi:hypothetical protein ACLKA7_007834 [Drosophila subpalustris]